MKNNDNWLKSIADRLNGLEVDEPDGLWDEIASNLPPAPVVKPSAKTGSRLLAIAASVGIAIIVSCVFFLRHPAGEPLQLSAGNCASQQPDLIIARHAAQSQTPIIPPVATSSPSATCRRQLEKAVKISGIQTVTVIMDGPKHLSTEPSIIHHTNTTTPTYLADNITDCNLTLPNHSHSHITLGTFTSGIAGHSGDASYRPAPYSTLNKFMNDEGFSDDKPLVRSVADNLVNSKDLDMQHRLPLRFGLSVGYRLSNQLTLESGISYSYLASDISYTGELDGMTGEQRLHYIGIPLNIIYNVAQWRSFRAYASAGVLGEKLISGHLTGQLTDNTGQTKQRSADLHERRLQWSLNAAAGLQYDITPAVGIYVEPGVSYHFDNHSEIRNIYKDQPCSFNLNIGLRLTLTR